MEPECAPAQLAKKAASRSGEVGHLRSSGMLLRSQNTWKTRSPVPYSSLVDSDQEAPITLVIRSTISEGRGAVEVVRGGELEGRHRSSLSLARQ